jgi:hypothetical protein
MGAINAAFISAMEAVSKNKSAGTQMLLNPLGKMLCHVM